MLRLPILCRMLVSTAIGSPKRLDEPGGWQGDNRRVIAADKSSQDMSRARSLAGAMREYKARYCTGRRNISAMVKAGHLCALGLAVLACATQAEDVRPGLGAFAPLQSFRECESCPEMIVMPSGPFMMGAIPGESRNPFDIERPVDQKDKVFRVRTPDEINIIPSEHPRHSVEMDIPYAIARNETTHAEWMACVEAGGCTHVPDHRVLKPSGYIPLGPDHPAINVSYFDALEYVAWLNKQVGKVVYRLPTEPEWEYAARAGTTTPFAQGDELTADQANFSRRATENLLGRGRQPLPELPELVNRYMPVPVDDLDAANGWGVRHMSGNVFELTQSCWSDEQLELSSDSAYLANGDTQRSCLRVVAKGGAFNTAMDSLRPAARVRPAKDTRRDFQGFRVVRVGVVAEL